MGTKICSAAVTPCINKRVFKQSKHHQKRKASLNIDKDIKVTTDSNIKQPLIIIK